MQSKTNRGKGDALCYTSLKTFSRDPILIGLSHKLDNQCRVELRESELLQRIMNCIEARPDNKSGSQDPSVNHENKSWPCLYHSD